MATLSAIRSLASAIKNDIADGVTAVQDKVKHVQSERRVVADFKAALREHPAEIIAALRNVGQQPASKPARKPRVKG